MTDDSTSRRLSAILAADVVAYSHMMGLDEKGTFDALKRHRVLVFDPAVAKHNGRIVKLMGDGTLAEFPSAYDAVNCAVEIQNKISQSNNPDGLTLRIGLNLGDVIIDGEDIYGDGVNIAARLEPLAEPGGICVSSIVNESVMGRVKSVFRDAGVVKVKNIERSIHIWKWAPDEKIPNVRPDNMAQESNDAATSSIAVLPFSNTSGDPEQDYFSDGISEDIITDLSKVSGLIVIARNSSFAYKGKELDIRNVGRELMVDSVLAGSVRRSGQQVRITAQLINASTGSNIWADRYDRTLDDIFATQDEVTCRIVDALKVNIAPAEAERMAESPTTNVEAHDLMLRIRQLLFSDKKDRQMFEQVVWLSDRAIELDSGFAEPYAAKSMAFSLDAQNGWTGDSDAIDKAMRMAEIAVAKGPSLPYGHYVLANQAFWKNDLARAQSAAETALSLSPNYALAYGTLSLVKIFSGDPQAAIPLAEKAMRLDPAFLQQYLHFLGTAYLVLRKFEMAVATFRERIRLVPDTDLSRGLLISALGNLDQPDEARQVHSDLARISPQYSLESHLARLPFANPADAEHIRQGYYKAGIKA